MTEEEIRKKIEQLEKKIKKNEFRIGQLEVAQLAKKLLINSSYGSLSSRSNPIGDDDLANAITVMGSTSIKQVNVIAKDFVRYKRPDVSEEDIENHVIVANDTDSSMLSLGLCDDIKVFDENGVTKEGYELVNEMYIFINEQFTKWFLENTNSDKCTLNFKREKICDLGLYLLKKSGDEEAKKNYVLHVLDNEGDTHPKFVYKGVKFARSVIPKELKTEGMRVVEDGMFTLNKSATDELARNLFEKYKSMPLQERSGIQRIKDMDKYSNVGMPVGQYALKTPAHVKAGLNYNYMIDYLDLKHLSPIKSGETVFIVHLEPNDFGFDQMAFTDSWPKEFDEYFQIDHIKGFNKIIYDELIRFYQSMGWVAFNPSSNYQFSILDILDL